MLILNKGHAVRGMVERHLGAVARAQSSPGVVCCVSPHRAEHRPVESEHKVRHLCGSLMFGIVAGKADQHCAMVGSAQIGSLRGLELGQRPALVCSLCVRLDLYSDADSARAEPEVRRARLREPRALAGMVAGWLLLLGAPSRQSREVARHCALPLWPGDQTHGTHCARRQPTTARPINSRAHSATSISAMDPTIVREDRGAHGVEAVLLCLLRVDCCERRGCDGAADQQHRDQDRADVVV